MRRGGDAPVAVVIMGVSGVGKSTVGRALSKKLGWHFAEGDTLHPPANIAKMASGQPLTDADRAPWLGAVAEVIGGWARRGEHGVVTCSALKRAYRRQIIGDDDVRLVYLKGSPELVGSRPAARQGHFMPPGFDGKPIRRARTARPRRKSDRGRCQSADGGDRKCDLERSLPGGTEAAAISVPL